MKCKCFEKDSYKCTFIRKFTFPKCHHTCEFPCYQITQNKVKCYHTCDAKLYTCHHLCGLTCGHSGPHRCDTIWQTTCPRCNGTINYKCGTKPECPHNCPTVFPCGHKCQGKCCECATLSPIVHICHYKCNYVFPCGRKCQFECGDPSLNHQHLFCPQCTQENQPSDLPAQVPDDEILIRCRNCWPKCGSQCKCVESEICYFGCKHERFQCPEQKELLFAWPCHHVELLREAKSRIETQFSDPNRVHYPYCPTCSQLLTTSIVFAKEIARTKILKRYYKKGKEKYHQITISNNSQLLRCQYQCQLLNDPRSCDGFGVRIIEQNTSNSPTNPNKTKKPNTN